MMKVTIIVTLLAAVVRGSEILTGSCFAPNADVVIGFNNDNAMDSDWIGLFPSSDVGLQVPEPRTRNWIWTCGDRNCDTSPSGGFGKISNPNLSGATEWVAVMARFDGGSVIVASNPFRVSSSCDGPSPAQPSPPRPSPTNDAAQATKVNPALITAVREDIAELIDDDIELAAKFLRLGFHDSVGGPDGCVDLTNIHNRGLDVPIDALAPIVEKYKGIFSRTDIWMFAAVVGPHVTQRKIARFKADFDITEYGRIDCENQQSVCRNEAGISHGCSATRGPHREIPGANTNTHDLFAFFKENFDFGRTETVAIMGAHTIGVLQRKNSGVHGPDGWVVKSRRFNHEYYKHLVGRSPPDDTVTNLMQLAPLWTSVLEDNSDLPDFDDLHIWHGFAPGLDGRPLVMLNADIALVRDLNTSNMNPETGEVSCQFVDRAGDLPTCPHVEGAIQDVARYQFSNEAWLIDFENALRKMINTGYVITTNCVDELCELAKA